MHDASFRHSCQPKGSNSRVVVSMTTVISPPVRDTSRIVSSNTSDVAIRCKAGGENKESLCAMVAAACETVKSFVRPAGGAEWAIAMVPTSTGSHLHSRGDGPRMQQHALGRRAALHG